MELSNEAKKYMEWLAEGANHGLRRFLWVGSSYQPRQINERVRRANEWLKKMKGLYGN